MPNKLPWMMFYPADWSNDPALTLCTPATRGVWIDLICAMHELESTGEFSGTVVAIADVCRCSPLEALIAINDLSNNRTADITRTGPVYTIVCRRMRRDAYSSSLKGMRAWIRKNYARLEKAISRRDGRFCKWCGTQAGLQIDHHRPLAKGGRNSIDNLQFLCGTCNRRKGSG
jgi:hypothetical protein